MSLRQQGASDAALLDAYPHLSAADLVNVWAYAAAYPEEVTIALQEQADAMQDDRTILKKSETLSYEHNSEPFFSQNLINFDP